MYIYSGDSAYVTLQARMQGLFPLAFANFKARMRKLACEWHVACVPESSRSHARMALAYFLKHGHSHVKRKNACSKVHAMQIGHALLKKIFMWHQHTSFKSLHVQKRIQIRMQMTHEGLNNLMQSLKGRFQPTQNIWIMFVQRWTSVEDVGPTLYKCYVNVLCLLHGCIYYTCEVTRYCPFSFARQYTWIHIII